ncbi:3'-5' exonuclease family protein [Glacieibacterium frigidum]|uniref:Predicted 3'-5' exonuclease PolB-like domain-containing protein n=1 Tax=Glacieibacterium frigidum TaxID=2593303 RepID=A0A552UHN5_9SPHN|nr:ribonuclease H-like domain-containing protein [Glacieibacterium frigidum]TRW17733.1 hypothetical protein FMM06_06245 [Glacieibacterium frigidum]
MKTVTIDLSTMPNGAIIDRHPPRGDQGDLSINWATHEIAACAALVVEHDPRQGLIFQMFSFSRGDMSEARIVREIDGLCGNDLRLVMTFNGRGFDLPLLRLRAIANWADAPNLHRINAEVSHSGAIHRDLLDTLTSRGSAPKPRLAQVCAALNIPSKDDRDADATDYVHQDRWDRCARYCEIDVISTWLLNLHLEAHQTVDLHRVQDGWSALAKWIEADQSRLARLQRFTRLPLFGCPPDGAGALGDRPLVEVTF